VAQRAMAGSADVKAHVGAIEAIMKMSGDELASQGIGA
jgi:hypothetical protein